MTVKERKALRARGHHLRPVVQVGQAGVHPALERKVESELQAHELIKVKVGQGGMAAGAAAEALALACGAEVVQVIGRTLLLYRERVEDEEEGD